MPFGAYAPLPLRLGGSPEEGLTAAQYLRMTADLAALRRSLPLAIVVGHQNDGAPRIDWYAGRNGVGTLDRPTIHWDPGIGRTVLTWPPSYRDRVGQTYRVRIAAARGVLNEFGFAGRLEVDDITRSNRVTFRPVTRGGVLRTDAAFTIKVY